MNKWSTTDTHTHRTPHTYTRYNVDSKKFCIIYERSANGGNTRRTQARTHTKAARERDTQREGEREKERGRERDRHPHTVRDDARTTDLNAIALKYVVSCSLSTGYGC